MCFFLGDFLIELKARLVVADDIRGANENYFD